MIKAPTNPLIPETRRWPFTISALTAGVRRHLKDFTVEIIEIQSHSIPQQRSSLSSIRGMRVICKTSQGTQTLDMVVKQAFASSRAGSASAGWRERSLYSSMMDFIPIKIPTMVAADQQGEWLVLNLLPGGRLAERWGQADYMLAVEQMAVLHERFWGLGEDLANYNWLGRPLDSEVQFLIASAQAGLNRLWQAPATHPLRAELATFDRLISYARVIATRLRELPTTLLHGDFWPGNLIIYPDKTLYALDWQMAAIGPAILDLVIFTQKSLWQFEILPTSVSRLTAHYRGLLQNTLNIQWTDQVWDAYWDHAMMWLFLADWMEVLGRAPVSVINTHQAALERVWLRPLQVAVERWLKKG
jgi:Ser/Thr protein kinase RdoA (MazF antagonist)